MSLWSRLNPFNRQAPETQKRHIEAAYGGRRGASGPRHFGSHGPETLAAAPLVRSRARHAYANNGYIRNAVNAVVAEAVGAGIEGNSGHPDAETAALIDTAFFAAELDADLGMLGDTTAAFGEAAAQTEADILVNLITSNPNLSDGTAVFDASRGNLASSGVALGGAGVQDELEAARKAMRTTKGLDGRTLINVTPKYLLVGPDSESDAERLLASIYPATTDNVNIYASKLNLLVEPRLEGPAWYIFADPSRLAAFQYGYLSSAQGVQIQRSEAWTTLGMRFRAWLDFGAGWLESRAAYLNEGA